MKNQPWTFTHDGPRNVYWVAHNLKFSLLKKNVVFGTFGTCAYFHLNAVHLHLPVPHLFVFNFSLHFLDQRSLHFPWMDQIVTAVPCISFSSWCRFHTFGEMRVFCRNQMSIQCSVMFCIMWQRQWIKATNWGSQWYSNIIMQLDCKSYPATQKWHWLSE